VIHLWLGEIFTWHRSSVIGVCSVIGIDVRGLDVPSRSRSGSLLLPQP
jgi:hypothetical protein